MRVALISESFPPDVNGVANSVVRVAEHLHRRGHHPLVIAPRPASASRAVGEALPYPVVRIPSVPTPGYRAFRLSLPAPGVAGAVHAHRADVVHLASPFVLGARGMAAASALELPTVAVFQTDVPAYLRTYRLGFAESWAWGRLRRIHNAADRTLAGSTATAADLLTHGIDRVWLWRRGVDAERFAPRYRSDRLRAVLAPRGETIVGYVGRLAPEKRVDLLARVARMPGVRVVVVGDGPERARLERLLPDAVFLGTRRGEQLARIYASLDLFVHPGPHETFGQTVQEALASGLPVVAPAAGGPVDLVEPGRTGLLVRPGDARDLAEAVGALVASPERRRTYGAAARAWVAGRTWASVGDELLAHYRAVAGLGQPAAAGSTGVTDTAAETGERLCP
ncbi:MAG: glycosyltransferase family 1 protein [Dactylosporangium sp.]|nr:glycosyltransferase family 1 protein [Dactylosporangium sp.]NNJ62015.1 glycosyltransferase family 1 protein [Dactylosporangium sp.]